MITGARSENSDLRGTLAVDSGITCHAVASALGHESFKTTAAHYAKREAPSSLQGPQLDSVWNRRRRLALAIAIPLVVAAVLLALRMHGHPVPSLTSEQTHPSPPTPADLGRQAARALMEARAMPAAVPSQAGDMLKDYPTTSRPVQSRAESFKYNRRDLAFLGVPGPDKSGPPAFHSMFTADKFNVFEADAITLTLRASKGPSMAAGAFPITNLSAGITKCRAQDAPTVDPNLRQWESLSAVCRRAEEQEA